jgi:hypothetical protein
MANSIRFYIFLWLIVIVLLTSCRDRITAPCYPDPLAESFRDKNPSYILRIDKEEPNAADSIILDVHGNIVRTVEPGSVKRFEYDKRHFITRMWVRDDSPVHYKIDYRREDNYLVQYWTNIRSRKWNYSNDDLGERYKTVYFKVNTDGKIIEEIDSLSGDREAFDYFRSGSLKARTRFDLYSGGVRYTWIYTYDEQNRVHFVGLELPDGNLVESFYISNGSLDSSRTMKGRVYEYKYFYR